MPTDSAPSERGHAVALFHNSVLVMRPLHLDFVIQNDYVNLRCNVNPGCTKGYKRLKLCVNGGLWEEIFDSTTTLLVLKRSRSRFQTNSALCGQPEKRPNT